MDQPDQPWRILVVDDEADVHAVTTLALKRRTWRGKPLALFSAYGAAETRKLLVGAPFHVALIDVVMETTDAGLVLCDEIRHTQPRWTRIVLRTSQPGRAPEATVLNDYDVDYYLAKAEVTQDRLLTTVQASLRNSQEVLTLMLLGDQLPRLAQVLATDDSPEALVASFEEIIRFLETKYNAGVGLFADFGVSRAETLGPTLTRMGRERVLDLDKLRAATTATALAGKPEFAAQRIGPTLLIPFAFESTPPPEEASGKVVERVLAFLSGRRQAAAAGCVAVQFQSELTEKAIWQVVADLKLFGHNWKLAYQLVLAQREMGENAARAVMY